MYLETPSCVCGYYLQFVTMRHGTPSTSRPWRAYLYHNTERQLQLFQFRYINIFIFKRFPLYFLISFFASSGFNLYPIISVMVHYLVTEDIRNLQLSDSALENIRRKFKFFADEAGLENSIIAFPAFCDHGTDLQHYSINANLSARLVILVELHRLFEEIPLDQFSEDKKYIEYRNITASLWRDCLECHQVLEPILRTIMDGEPQSEILVEFDKYY